LQVDKYEANIKVLIHLKKTNIYYNYDDNLAVECFGAVLWFMDQKKFTKAG
jgi:hypothetical protein